MAWTITLHPDAPIIETNYVGQISSKELRAAVDTTLDKVTETGRLCLIGNCSAMLSGGHSEVDLYYLAESVKAHHQEAMNLKEALLLPYEMAAAELVQFWETKCVNLGLRVRAFHERDAAIAWLTEGK